MTMAGAAAIFELDMKKVIALSTLRQLGVIFFSLGMGQPFMAFFHLISHAYFKAILFIAAGSIIHTVKDYQDLRKIGGSLINLPALATVCLVRNLSLCGMPFLSGFYSKDLILESLFTQGPRALVFGVGMVATGLTVVYSCRLTLGIFNLKNKVLTKIANIKSYKMPEKGSSHIAYLLEEITAPKKEKDTTKKDTIKNESKDKKSKKNKK